METAEISAHLFRVFDFVKQQSGWVTSEQIAKGAKVAGRTARLHALKLVHAGIFDQAEVFPGHRYRFSKLAEKRNKTFYQRLEQTRELFGSTGESNAS